MELTLEQLRQITLIAQRLGLSQAEVEGILQALLALAVQPDNVTRLEMAVQMMPPAQRQAAREFIEVMAAQGEQRRQERAGVAKAVLGGLLAGLGLDLMLTGLLTEYQREVLVQFGMQPDDEAALAADILRHRIAAWQTAIEESAAKVGARPWANPPSGSDLEDLRRMSEADAASIVRTYNRDLESEIRQLYATNPEGDLAYYLDNLNTWHRQRAAWKDRQIAMMNHKTARHHAVQRFVEMNRIRTDYRFAGPPPVCDDCAGYFAVGIVDQLFVLENPAPVHPNCPHEWAMVNPRAAVPLTSLWRG